MQINNVNGFKKMKLINLLEHDVKGDKVTKSYDKLYHITDYTGVAHTVKTNTLNAQRQGYISVTYDDNVTVVGGRDHYHFRFIINGDVLNKYDGFYYTSWARVSDGSKHWYDEKEIGVQTTAINPFSQFCEGFEILINVFSRSLIQWLFYKTESIRGIEALAIIKTKWKVPLYVNVDGRRPLTKEENDFLTECFKVRDLPFEDALRHLVQKFDIADHFGGKITTKKIDDAEIINTQLDKINDIVAGKKYKDINIVALEKTVYETLEKIDPNFKNTFDELKSKGIFSVHTKPVNWSILFKEISKDSEYSYIDEMVKEIKNSESFYNDPMYADFVKNASHARAGT